MKSHRAKAEDAFYIKKRRNIRRRDNSYRCFRLNGCRQFVPASPARLEYFPCRRLEQLALGEESTEEEIRKANGDFLAEVKYLKEKAPNIDLVLFPVDRRMGKDYMKGAKQFIEQIKTTIFVPMHFSEDYEGGMRFVVLLKNAGCRFISITHRGESFEITK